MTYKKGTSGNPDGRPKGAVTKINAEAKGLFVDIMNGEVDNIKESLSNLREESDDKYLKVLAQFFPYFMPKQTDIEVTLNRPTTNPTWFDEVIERPDQKDTFFESNEKPIL